MLEPFKKTKYNGTNPYFESLLRLEDTCRKWRFLKHINTNT